MCVWRETFEKACGLTCPSLPSPLPPQKNTHIHTSSVHTLANSPACSSTKMLHTNTMMVKMLTIMMSTPNSEKMPAACITGG